MSVAGRTIIIGGTIAIAVIARTAQNPFAVMEILLKAARYGSGNECEDDDDAHVVRRLARWTGQPRRPASRPPWPWRNWA